MRTPAESNHCRPAALVTLDPSQRAVLTDSRVVAREFGKRHDNVLRDIRRILQEVPAEFAKLNFEVCFEISSLQNSKRLPYYRLTKDAFLLLVMGFNGPKAMAVKLAFIEAFNRMAETLQTTAMASLRAYNEALQVHLADKRHVSVCGRDMRRWQRVKPQQLATLEQLFPQIPLFPITH